MYKKYTRNFHRQIQEEIVSLWIQIKCADFIVNLSLLYIIISSQLYMNFVLELKKNWTKGTIGLTVECSFIYKGRPKKTIRLHVGEFETRNSRARQCNSVLCLWKFWRLMHS
jgi:hypothetical protein